MGLAGHTYAHDRIIFGFVLIWVVSCAVFPRAQDEPASGTDAATGTGPGAGAGAGTGAN
jgi:hypothetical protein